MRFRFEFFVSHFVHYQFNQRPKINGKCFTFTSIEHENAIEAFLVNNKKCPYRMSEAINNVSSTHELLNIVILGNWGRDSDTHEVTTPSILITSSWNICSNAIFAGLGGLGPGLGLPPGHPYSALYAADPLLAATQHQHAELFAREAHRAAELQKGIDMQRWDEKQTDWVN